MRPFYVVKGKAGSIPANGRKKKEKVMTLADLKVQSLLLLNINDIKISVENLEDVESDNNYKDLFSRMPAAIMRAMNRIKAAGVIPKKTYDAAAVEDNTNIARYDLSTEISDFSKLVRVVVSGNNFYCGNYPYTFEGINVVLFGLRKGWNVTFIYEPKLPFINIVSDNATEIPLPEELASIIPYFVKADIYEQDEPELSTQARNIFEGMLAAYVPQEENVEAFVESVYKSGW